MTVRSRPAAAPRACRQRAPDDGAAMALVGGELDEVLEDVTSESERRRSIDDVENVRKKADRTRPLTRDDWMGALTSFWLVYSERARRHSIPDVRRRTFRVARIQRDAAGDPVRHRLWWARYAPGKPWLVGLVLLPLGGLPWWPSRSSWAAERTLVTGCAVAPLGQVFRRESSVHLVIVTRKPAAVPQIPKSAQIVEIVSTGFARRMAACTRLNRVSVR